MTSTNNFEMEITDFLKKQFRVATKIKSIEVQYFPILHCKKKGVKLCNKLWITLPLTEKNVKVERGFFNGYQSL